MNNAGFKKGPFTRHGQSEGELTKDGETPLSRLLQEVEANMKTDGTGPTDTDHTSLIPRIQSDVEKDRVDLEGYGNYPAQSHSQWGPTPECLCTKNCELVSIIQKDGSTSCV